MKIGRANPPISALRQVIDYIEIFDLSYQGIFDKASVLYASGSSLRAIADELAISKTTIRQTLIRGGIVLQPSNGRPIVKSISLKRRHIGHAPYGFVSINGQLIEDPKEQSIIQKILKLRSAEMSLSDIARKLNELRIKPRSSKAWDHSTVRSILNRYQKNEIQTKGENNGTR